jgi:hypothetical protein
MFLCGNCTRKRESGGEKFDRLALSLKMEQRGSLQDARIDAFSATIWLECAVKVIRPDKPQQNT